MLLHCAVGFYRLSLKLPVYHLSPREGGMENFYGGKGEGDMVFRRRKGESAIANKV